MDVLTIVADTLRTMMGATAADPYIKAIERNVAAAELQPDVATVSLDALEAALVSALGAIRDERRRAKAPPN